jgi:hypothetical protein
MSKLLAVLALFAGLAGQAPAPERYAEGQVWEYRTRPGDEGSLLKIQRIEAWPDAPSEDGRRVYHISLIGVRFGPQRPPSELQHFPVSRETLDASVVRPSETIADFPIPDEGIAAWRADRGGVFTIPVAEIVEALEQMLSRQPQ